MRKAASLVNQRSVWKFRVSSCSIFQDASPYRFGRDITKEFCTFINNMYHQPPINIHDIHQDSFYKSQIFSRKRHPKASRRTLNALAWTKPFKMSWSVSKVFFVASLRRVRFIRLKSFSVNGWKKVYATNKIVTEQNRCLVLFG